MKINDMSCQVRTGNQQNGSLPGARSGLRVVSANLSYPKRINTATYGKAGQTKQGVTTHLPSATWFKSTLMSLNGDIQTSRFKTLAT